MFGSNNPFGQSTSPFGSPSVFGQSGATNNPFAPKPFSSPNPFGSQTGTSIFGGTSTGVFGASHSSSPFSSTTTFGASSSPAFGSSTPTFGASSTPAFGASSTPAFGSSSSPFGGSSVFGQKPSFGSFGATSTQTSPFGNTSQQSQPSFGSSIFGSSTPFASSSQPAFGATSMPAFGATSTPAFGATSTPAFGSTTSPAFGATNTAFGASSSPVFGSSSTPAFGASSTPSFGAPSTPSFGASSTPSFSFGSTPAFGQSTSAFGSSPFGAGSSPFGAQSSAFGLQSTTPAFTASSIGQSGFGGKRGGSRVTAYTPTIDTDAGQAGGPPGKLESISAMPVYKDKSHEELRWEDYQLGDKGGPTPAQSTGAVGFGSTAQPGPFGPPSTFGQSSASPFSSSMTSNLFGQKPWTFGTGFGASSGSTFASSGFGSSFSTTPLISSSTSTFGPASSALNFGSSPSLFSSSQAPGTSSPFGSSFGNTQSSQLFNTTGSQIGQTAPAFGQATSLFGQSTAPTFNQTSPFSTNSSFGGNMFAGNTSLFGQSTPSLSTSFQPTPTPQTSSTFGFGNFGLSQPFGAGISSGAPGMFSQSNMSLQSATLSSAVMQPVPVMNPFGTLPAMPHISIGQGGTAPSIQYGISSMPVLEKPAPVRISSLLTSRHLSQRRTKLPVKKYHPKNDILKVPFFSDDEDTTTTPKADALFIPRENPRALVISPMEPRSAKASEKVSSLMGRSNANGNVRELTSSPTTRSNAEKRDQDLLKRAGSMEQVQPINEIILTSNGYKEDQSPPKGDSYMTLSGHRAGEAAIVYEHGADIESLMPKLRRSDYFTEPRIQELAAKERAEPGFCRHVKDFIVGRQGYGSIKFSGETDVRRLDIESLVEFNNREVIVYMDDSKKPPVGQGLNKPAEVTLLNIKCFDKKTGHQYTEGPKIEKYKEMLKKKAEDQGAEFISYDPIKGEWKFRVSHFSSYNFSDGE